MSVNGYLRTERREEVTEGPSMLVDRFEVEPHVRGPGGGVRTGILAALVDSTGGFCGGLAALPDWVVSTNLMLAVGVTDHVGPIRLEARVLRKGGATVVTSVDLRDEGADDRLAATALMTSAVLHPGPERRRFKRPLAIPAPPRVEDPEPVDRFFALHAAGPGVTRLELLDRLRNPWRILHGGATTVLIDAAASAGTGVVTELVVHFVSPARVGPMEAHSTVVGSRAAGERVVRVAVRDAGNGGRVTALAAAVVTA